MITNERQYRISKTQLEKLRTAASDFQKEIQEKGASILAQAELAALKSQAGEIHEQIREYDALQSGTVSILKASNLAQLPRILIKARIARGLSQKNLAELVGIKEQQIQRYEAEEYSTANLQRLTEVANALNLNISEVAELKQEFETKKEQFVDKLDWTCFPVKEMYKRNWFSNYIGSLPTALAEGERLVRSLMATAGKQPQLALHRKRVRSGASIDLYALLAWQCRVLSLSNTQSLGSSYKQEVIDNTWISRLVQLSSFSDGPRRACDFLKDAGIAVVIEPHLASTHLDGAALLGDNGPVIGLTLRYDRLDNFWFVLLHELAHVKNHLKKGRLEDIYDDLDADADELELDADNFAGHALIPEGYWETALARYLRTEISVKACAEELKISEAIIAGRIRKEADNYVILNEQVGFGKVRKLFPEIRFEQ